MIRMLSKALIIALLFFLYPEQGFTYKILVVPVQQMSHLSSMMAIANELSKHGHEVQVMIKKEYVKSFATKYSESKIKLINFSSYVDPEGRSFEEATAKFAMSVFEGAPSLQETLDLIRRFSRSDCTNLVMDTEETLVQLTKEGGFDVAVVDINYMSLCYYLIPYRLRIPWITYTDFPLPWDIRVPWLPSFVPQQFSKFTERMDFLQRLKNTMLHAYMYVNAPKMENTEDDATLLKFQNTYGAFGSLYDLVKRSELFLVTSDAVLDYPKPSMPTFVEIGGLTIEDPKPLADSLSKFMDDAELGVIVVSFGSMMSQYPSHFVEKFVDAFKHLSNYRVVWRFQNRENVTLPGNVITVNWLPQIDVLAHPKTKLFITHCGNNGQFEGMYYKVPMIGFPFHADQHYNAKRIEYKGYGHVVNIYDFTADELVSKISTILSNPSYKERIARASDIFRSATEKPAERATRWIEHICRFGGDHLRSAGNDLHLHQYLLFDVLGVLFICTIGLMLLGYIILKYIIKRAIYLRKRKHE